MEINYNDISELLTLENHIGSGREVDAYKVGNEVIKIFKNDGNQLFERLSDNDMFDLSKLELNCFNNFVGFIYNDNEMIGYKEKYLDNGEFQIEDFYDDNKLYKFLKCLNRMKDDIRTLSDNGYIINDVNYNYVINNNEITIYDMTSYKRIVTDNEFMKNKIYNDNIKTMNIFLIGLTIYDLYREGNSNEYTGTYKAVTYNDKYCKDEFFGDVLKKMNSLTDEELNKSCRIY